MNRLILKLTLAGIAIGLCAATPVAAQTPQQQMYIRAQQRAMWNRISIFSQPQFHLVTDPRGANFGISQQILWGPSLRSVFSPWSQTTIFRSNASSQLVWTPMMGAVARINTPATFGFTTNANGVTRAFSFPSISVLSNVNGSTRFLNPNTPTFLSGNFNVSVPLNGIAAIPMSSSSVSAGVSNSAAAALNSTLNNSASAMNATLSERNSASTSANATASRIFRRPANPGPNQAWLEGAMGNSAAAAIMASRIYLPPANPGSNQAWLLERSNAVTRQAASYNGYVPANQIIP